MTVSRGVLAGSVALVLAASPLGAQRAQLREAMLLEQRGNYIAAVNLYRAVLDLKPGDSSALLGLERTLQPLNRSAEILVPVQAALKLSRGSTVLYGVAIRAWAAENERDSVRAMADRWARLAPEDETPYREWGDAALAMGDRAAAVTAYRLGRQRLGVSDALAPELAQLATSDGDYATALREWVHAIAKTPEYQSVAVAGLSRASVDLQPGLLEQLAKDATPDTRSLEAELRAVWGDPLGGIEILRRALPTDRARAAELLRSFLDQVRTVPGTAAKRAQGRALEALAEQSSGPQAVRLRLEAADAYSDGGDRDAAHRIVTQLANGQEAPEVFAAEAGATLVTILIREGRVAEAGRSLERLRTTLASERYDRLRRDWANGWARMGALTRADSVLASDTTVEGFAARGWIRLYQGDIAGAIERFTAAGPFAGGRVDATARTVVLALLQPITADSVPELGRAFLTAMQGDTAAALDAFERAAATLTPAQGGAGVLLYAGRLVAAREVGAAERLFRAAAVPEAPGVAPAAELALGELLLAQGRNVEAVQTLEHLILTYPQSALVAQARRKLDQARGAVPKT